MATDPSTYKLNRSCIQVPYTPPNTDMARHHDSGQGPEEVIGILQVPGLQHDPEDGYASMEVL